MLIAVRSQNQTEIFDQHLQILRKRSKLLGEKEQILTHSYTLQS